MEHTLAWYLRSYAFIALHEKWLPVASHCSRLYCQCLDCPVNRAKIERVREYNNKKEKE